MRQVLTKTLQKYSFWVALLLHLLLYLSLSLILLPTKYPNENRELTIPAFMYQEAPHVKPLIRNTLKNLKKPQEISPQGLQKPALEPESHELNQIVPKSAKHSLEPVNLIGQKGIPQPLIVLLGKALTHYLLYPKIAIDLNIRGVSVIGFLVHPNGEITDIRLIETSHADLLDNTALEAAHHISPVKNVDQYLKEPKFIIFGIIFGSR